MTTYRYDSIPAIDAGGDIARDAIGNVYAVTDTARETPLPVTDLTGVPMASLATNHLGLLPPFAVEDHKQVIWVSGQHEAVLMSLSGVLEDVAAAQLEAQTARDAAQQAAQAAQAAAGLIGAPADSVLAALISHPDTTTYQVLLNLIASHGGGEGGGGEGDAMADELEAVRRYDTVAGEWPPANRGEYARLVWEGPAAVPTSAEAQPGDIRRRIVES